MAAVILLRNPQTDNCRDLGYIPESPGCTALLTGLLGEHIDELKAKKQLARKCKIQTSDVSDINNFKGVF